MITMTVNHWETYIETLKEKNMHEYKNESPWGNDPIYYYGKHKRLIIKARLNSESIENKNL